MTTRSPAGHSGPKPSPHDGGFRDLASGWALIAVLAFSAFHILAFAVYELTRYGAWLWGWPH